MKKLGIVFSGGGGKGAYQIGAWQALQELKISAQVVSGTSVGALNGALYVQGDLECAKQAWLNISSANILSFNENLFSPKVLKAMHATGINKKIFTSFIKSKGFFSQEGLMKMIRENLDTTKLYGNTTSFYATTHKKLDAEVEYFHVNDPVTTYDNERMINILLASAAIPIFFDNIEIDGELYYDGGWPFVTEYSEDNNPIMPVYNNGCDVIIWIALSRDDIMDYSRFPGTRVIPIVPSIDLGGIVKGTLDFSSEGARWRMETGYQDALEILSQLELFVENEQAYKQLWEQYIAGEEELNEGKSNIRQQDQNRIDIYSAMKDFNQILIKDDWQDESELIIAPEKIDLHAESATKLINDIERREIKGRVDNFMAKNSDNSNDIQRSVMEAVGYLAPIQTRQRDILQTGFFWRIWGQISGKTDKRLATTDADLARAQYAALELIKHVQSKQLLTFEATIVINNKVNRLFTEIANLSEDINKQTAQVYRSMMLMFYRVRKEILKDRSRIDALEDRIAKLEWLMKIDLQTYNGTEYRHLPTVGKLICVINDFYRMTSGQWTLNEILSLKKALIDLNIEQETIALTDITTYCQQQPLMTAKLFEGLYNNNIENVVTMGNMETVPTPVPTFHMAIEGLVWLREQGYSVLQESLLSDIKAEYASKIESIKRIAEEYSLSKISQQELLELQNSITSYKVLLPLMGSFSAGKSTLLNKYIGRDILPTDLLPMTAIATELHWTEAGNERLVVYDSTNHQTVYPLTELSNITELHDDILYAQVHINSPVLAKHRDIILVDMPGNNSNLESHYRAISNYINRAQSFIFCIMTSMEFLESDNVFLQELSMFDKDIHVLLTKKELVVPSTADNLIETTKNKVSGLLGREIVIKQVGALKLDFAGLRDLIALTESKKDIFFKEYFLQQIEAVANNTKNQLSWLLNEDNMTIAQLEQKKKEIHKKAQNLKSILVREKEQMLRELTNVVPEKVSIEIKRALEQIKPTIVAEAKAGVDIGDRIKGVMVNVMQTAIQKHSVAIFSKVAAKMSQYVAQHIYITNKTYDGAELQCNKNIANNKFDAVSLTASSVAGLLAVPVLGPIVVGILGGILGFLAISKRKEQERLLAAEVDRVMYQAAENSKPETARILMEMADKFFIELDTKVNSSVQEMMDNITLLETEIAKNEQQDDQKCKMLEAYIADLKKMTDTSVEELADVEA